MRHPTRLAWLSVVLCLTGLCAPGGTYAVPSKHQATRKILSAAYGQPNTSGQFVARFDDTLYDITLASEQGINTPYGKRLYLVAQGQARDAAHVTAGLNGLFVAAEHDGVWTVVAATPYVPTGGHGAPGAFHGPLRLGADHYYGWILDSGYTAQGYTSVVQLVLAPLGQKVATLARVGSCLPQTEISINVNTSDGQARVYPLRLKVSQLQGTRRARINTVQAPFDLKTFRYLVPKKLAEGTC